MSKKTVLIVDDEKDLQNIVAEMLSPLGVNIIKADNGEDGYKMILSHKPDLVISDIKMPKLDGLQMLAQIKSAGIEVPVIIITAFGDKEKIKQAWRLGAFDFLDKPVEPEAILHTAQSALSMQKEHKKDSRVANALSLVLNDQTLYKKVDSFCKKNGITISSLTEELFHEFLENENDH